MTDKEYVPRFSFEITEEQRNRADKLLNVYGVRKTIMSNVLDSILDLVEEHGQIIVGLLLDKEGPKEILRPIAKAKQKAEK